MRIPALINIHTKSKAMYYLLTPLTQNKYCETVYHSSRPKKKTKLRSVSPLHETRLVFFFFFLTFLRQESSNVQILFRQSTV
jgi:hypothetical protein